MATQSQETLKSTPLERVHLARDAKMVGFAGYSMPVNYPLGVLKEHLHTRSSAGLFDVSHMGQAEVSGPGIDKTMETLVPGDIVGLNPGQIRYTILTNKAGGIIDDLMISRPMEPELAETLFLVVNAACKERDFSHIAAHLDKPLVLTRHDDAALIALQGPKAAHVLGRFVPAAPEMRFMTTRADVLNGAKVRLFRSGYTGEDGYEISIPAADAVRVAELLLEQPEVKPIGLGARDSLRLEAGLCLYGADIDTKTTPVEASLAWSIGKRRRTEGGFPGTEKIQHQLEHGAPRHRVGIRPLGRAPARAHTEIQNDGGKRIGEITSGGFGPSFNGPVAMGYVNADYAKVGTPVTLIVRGQSQDAQVERLPFVPHSYFKSASN